MSLQKIKNLKNAIEYVLEHNPATRNDDAYLTVMVIKSYFPEEIIKNEKDGRFFISYEITRIIREDHVKRIRAKIQNEERRFLPTDPMVAKKRGWAEEEWRKALGYNSN